MSATWIRDTFSATLLSGLTFKDWWTVLKDNRFDVDAANIPRALVVTAFSLTNSLLRFVEDVRLKKTIEKVEVPAPLFILGSARSGTSLLQSVLSQDRRFATPNVLQVQFPHIFLTAEVFLTPLLKRVLPEHRLIDSVRLSVDAPGEDEFALAFLSLCSPYFGMAFPRQKARYDRFVNMDEVSEEEIERWNRSFRYFLKKLYFRHGRPLILKSPPHFCRIRRLLHLFPDARFIHIHRHPFSVMQSKFHAMDRIHRKLSLQHSESLSETDHVLRHKRMCERYLSEKRFIPAGQLCEISYENFVLDPLSSLRSIYAQLGLPEFSAAEEAQREYLAGISDYQTTPHLELTPETKSYIHESCRSLFEHWGYDFEPSAISPPAVQQIRVDRGAGGG